jgi:hypothetical protein
MSNSFETVSRLYAHIANILPRPRPEVLLIGNDLPENLQRQIVAGNFSIV